MRMKRIVRRISVDLAAAYCIVQHDISIALPFCSLSVDRYSCVICHLHVSFVAYFLIWSTATCEASTRFKRSERSIEEGVNEFHAGN